ISIIIISDRMAGVLDIGMSSRKMTCLKRLFLPGIVYCRDFIGGVARVLGPGAAGFGNGGKGGGGSGSGGGGLGISGPVNFTVKEFESAGRDRRTRFLGVRHYLLEH